MPHTKESSYNIDKLLRSAVQPFYDLDADMLKSLNASIGKEPLTIPVVISNTEPPRLLNGSQRLKVLKSQGRQEIEGKEVVIEKRATTPALCEEWAIRLNLQRPIGTAMKKSMAKHYRTKKGWSGSKIAELFGVSPAAVSQWLKGEAKPDHVVGTDGIVRSTANLQQGGGRPPMDPWDNVITGAMPKAILRMISLLDDPDNVPDAKSLTGDQFLDAIDLLEQLRALVIRMIEAAEASAPPRVPGTPTKRAARKS